MHVGTLCKWSAVRSQILQCARVLATGCCAVATSAPLFVLLCAHWSVRSWFPLQCHLHVDTHLVDVPCYMQNQSECYRFICAGCSYALFSLLFIFSKVRCLKLLCCTQCHYIEYCSPWTFFLVFRPFMITHFDIITVSEPLWQIVMKPCDWQDGFRHSSYIVQLCLLLSEIDYIPLLTQSLFNCLMYFVLAKRVYILLKINSFLFCVY